MSCKICKSGVNDNRFLWKCDSCSKRFHAACIGVKREHEDLVREYMIPACNECQSRVSVELNLKELICQQSLLADQIKLQTEVNHRASLKLQNDSVLHEALDRLESQLDSIKNELNCINKGSSVTAAISSMKNQFSSLLDDTLDVVSKNVIDSFKSSMVTFQHGLDGIGIMTQEISDKLHQTKEDSQTNSVNIDVLDELRALSAAFASFEENLPTSLKCASPNIADELEDIELNLFAPSANQESNTGWRWFNGRRTSWRRWKADWSDDSTQNKKVNKIRSNRDRRMHRYDCQNAFDGFNNYNKVFYNYNNNINNKNRNIWTKGSGKTSSDRVLLQAAKRQFFGPPAMSPNNLPFINFQQGETLNPIIRQTNGSLHSAQENWSMRHPSTSKTTSSDPIFLY